MAVITPKRLKENEDFMWKLAEQQIDTFISLGECEFMGAYAQPFAVLVVSDLLGVPPEDRVKFRKKLIRQEQESGGAGVGGVSEAKVEHSPLAWLYDTFSTYIEDRRRNPKGDILTKLAAATFPMARCRSLSMSRGLPPTCSPPGRKPRCDCSATLSK
jgi:cytochrome P450